MYKAVVLLFVFAIMLKTTVDSCGTSGICGGGSYPNCQPPPPPTSCSCPTSYGCGQYGCYRLRARDAPSYRPVLSRTPLRELDTSRSSNMQKIKPVDVNSVLAAAAPTVAENQIHPTRHVDPNKAFLNCCMDRQLPDVCLSKCNFKDYSKSVLTAMYFKQDPCPLSAMKEMQFCAAQGRDHRSCCARNGVTTTLAGQKCLVFCDQRPGQVTVLDNSYISCFDRFENMMSCFWHDFTRFRAIK